mmetsp:Transcript_20651/g.43398  ORF Transcript_20651/g.43398 Transcript_20651/m.43398 type:complete len:218 (+) Transcript_20651:1816-2469(+)
MGMGIGWVIWVVLDTCFPDIVHYLVLSLSGNIRPTNHHITAIPPDLIRLLLVLDPLPHSQPQLKHEIRPRRNAIGVESIHILRQLPVPRQNRRRQPLCLLTRPETASSLLIHLGPGSHPVDGQVENLPGPYDFVKAIDVSKYLFEHFRFIEDGDLVFVIAVRAGVDDAVHVEVEVVDWGDGGGGTKAPVEDVGVLVCEPAEHFGDAEESGGRGGRRA